MDLEYSVIGPLGILHAVRVVTKIDNSEKIEIADELPDGRLSHIVIKGTTTPIGYFGNEALEKVNPKDKKLKTYHKLLEKIYRDTLK